MANQWVLVTGGSRGIGRGIVEALSAQGYAVTFTYRNSDTEARALTAELEQAGREVEAVRCDGTDAAEVERLSASLLLAKGAPYAIINNAGITRDGVMMRMTSSDWLDVINNNLNASFLMTRPFLAAMAERGDGVIINMSSVSGGKGNAGQTNYSATKAALSGMTRSLALEMGRFNIRVNAIAPGYIATEMLEQIPDAQRRAITQRIPLRRLGQVREVAALTAFMLSESGAYITGQTFVIDGGLSA